MPDNLPDWAPPTVAAVTTVTPPGAVGRPVGQSRQHGSLLRAIALSVFLACVVAVGAAIAVAALVSDGSGSDSDDGDGLAVLLLALLAMLAVGFVTLVVCFAVFSRRMRLSRRQQVAGWLSGVVMPVALAVSIAVYTVIADRGLPVIAWVALVATLAVAAVVMSGVSGWRSWGRLAPSVGVLLAVVLMCLGAGWANAGRHEREVKRGFIERWSVTLALPGPSSPWQVVDITSPTGYRSRELRLEVLVRNTEGVEVTVAITRATLERLCNGCAPVGVSVRRGQVWLQRPQSVDVFLVEVDEGTWMLTSEGVVDPAAAVALVDALDDVTTEQWLDAEYALDD